MENNHPLPIWAPRVKQQLIRRLYESDAQGRLDEELLNEVGWALHARCESFLQAIQATRGCVLCPVCGASITHNHGAEEILRCPGCGWEKSWQAYFATIQHKQFSGAPNIIDLFGDYARLYPQVREAQQKMLLIDRLIHSFHYYLRFGETRAAGVNLIEGNHGQVIAFLDTLTYGPGSTPNLQETLEDWRGKIDHLAELWAGKFTNRKTGD